jgi:hypothetical protein
MNLIFVKTPSATRWHWKHQGEIQCLNNLTKDRDEISVDLDDIMPQILAADKIDAQGLELFVQVRSHIRSSNRSGSTSRMHLEGGRRMCHNCLACLIEFLNTFKTTNEQVFPVHLSRKGHGRVWHWGQRTFGYQDYPYESTLCGSYGHREYPHCNYETHNVFIKSRDELMTVIDGNEPILQGDYICLNCLGMLRQIPDTQPLEQLIMKEIDTTKPVIISQDGHIFQAEGKTIAAAKELAKKTTKEDGIPATVLVPHTTYKRKTQPIQEVKHKLVK